MGVRGLASYFSHRELFFEESVLGDCRVVIDGDNLRFALYKWCPGLNHCFGGDYDKYARYVRQFFQRLLACGVTPIVVLDGGLDKSGQKLATVLQRLSEQASNAVACTPLNQGKVQVFPLFGREVFQEVLEELGVRVLQASFEADHVIAKLAMTEGCAVISNDSDFFIFDVEFIRLDSLNIEGDTITCSKFVRSKFLAHYGLCGGEKLHLLASLMGNDYIPPKVFESVFQNIKMPKKSRDGTERHRRIKGLLLYLARERTAEAALDRLLALFQEGERAALRGRVLASMAVYSGQGDCGLVSASCSTLAGRPLPPWLLAEHHAAHLPPLLLGLAASGKVLLGSQVEVRELATAQAAALPVWRTLAALLASLDPEGGEVAVYARTRARVGLWTTITPTTPPLGLAELREVGEGRRREVLQEVLCPGMKEQVEEVGEEVRLLVMVVHLWSASGPVSAHQVRAVVLCLLVLRMVDPATGGERSTRRLEALAEGAQGQAAELLQTAINLNPMFHLGEQMKGHLRWFEPHLVHSLSTLQAIAFAAIALNKLLGGVLPFPSISQLLNGTFIYNMTVAVAKGQFKEASLPGELAAEYRKTLDEVEKVVTNLTDETSKPKGKKSKRKAKNSCSEERRELVGEAKEAFCDVDNRFSLLGME